MLFGLAVIIVIDLSALALQCLAEGSGDTVSSADLPEKEIMFSISARVSEIRLSADGLEKAADNPMQYDLDFLQGELFESIEGIRGISKELRKFTDVL